MISNHDLEHYVLWRKTRIAKLKRIFGIGFFKNKSVLELGAGTGLVGKFLRERWGANVTFTEGRVKLIQKIRENNPKSRIVLMDHDLPWKLNKQFDFIIHWGLLYHLDNWQQDLMCAVKHLALDGILALESEVLDSNELEEIKVIEDAGDDQSLYTHGSRPSASMIEDHMRLLNLEFKRYDDTDLNAHTHRYDWVLKNSMKHLQGQRRFWIAS